MNGASILVHRGFVVLATLSAVCQCLAAGSSGPHVDSRGADFELDGSERLQPVAIGQVNDIRLTGSIVEAPQDLIFADDFESGDDSAWNQPDPPPQVTSGTLMHFDLVQCPVGWSGYAAAAGRTAVGVVPGGAVGGERLTALTDLQQILHGHGFQPVGVQRFAWAHRHAWSTRSNGRYTSWNASGNSITTTNWGNGMGSDGSGNYPYIGRNEETAFTDVHLHRHETDWGFRPTNLTLDATLPYVQLLLCEKN